MSGRNLGLDIKQVTSNYSSGYWRCRLKFLVLAPPLTSLRDFGTSNPCINEVSPRWATL